MALVAVLALGSCHDEPEWNNTVQGNFVDIAIQKVALPPLHPGENVLTVTQPFGERTNPETLYLLGRFGVRVIGSETFITALPQRLAFGDLATQGLPFYGGAVSYGFFAKAKEGKLTVRASCYRGGLIKVYCDGRDVGSIIYPPYDLTITGLTDGAHEIVLELLLHRYNTFGPVHLVNEKRVWHGPDAWRTEGDDWSDVYMLRRTGILKPPEIMEPAE